MKKVALHNLGCKVNAYETEAMQEMLENAGYQIVPFKEGADIYIINTCTVTNIADRKSRQMLHRARKMNPDAVVDLLTILEEYENKHHAKETAGHNSVFARELIDINHTKEYEPLRLSKTGEHTRAYIKVQDGCNQFCSYCIIPYARGRVRSRAKEDVMEEVKPGSRPHRNPSEFLWD